MSALRTYAELKQAVSEAERFLALISGEGGTVTANFDCTIKPAAGDAAKMPRAMRTVVDAIAAQRTPALLLAAVNELKRQLEVAANAARTEYANIAADAGLSL